MTAKSAIFSPAQCFIRLYSEILGSAQSKDLLWMFAGLFVGWWIYVPIHELLHVAGCLMSGGSVYRLELASMYGGLILSHIFDFVEAGGDYAGRLSGFSYTSDWGYAVTVFFPFILTLPGFLLLETAVANRLFWLFGAALPLTFAPLISLTGDMFELGSLFLYQVWSGPDGMHRSLISDDLFLLVKQIRQTETSGITMDLVAFIGGAFLTGAVLAWSMLMISANIGLWASSHQKYGS
jgi:hypothetical protein